MNFTANYAGATYTHGYTLNDKNQRTSATLPDGNKWNYTYDVMGQLTGAVKQDTSNNPLTNMNYFYDLIGNRISATENSATTTYTSNLVNQYTAVNAIVPVYDLDGNMTSYNGWTYTYNGENRLIVTENAAAGVRVEADYDYMGRRIFKKVYNNNALTKHSVYVYDGFKQIAEFDALNGNALTASYLWQPVGLDIVLLRNNEYLVADGNKNIIQVRNVTGSVTDSYVYDPFGKVTHNGSSENPFRFSSEFFDSEMELVYYNYRHYMPILGRWINRDPIEEKGGINLYIILNNECLGKFDYNGLFGDGVIDALINDINESPSNIWYCERAIEQTNLSKEDIQLIAKWNVQHAYINFGKNPWNNKGNTGVGFSGGNKGTLPSAENYFHPTRCRACHNLGGYFRKLQYGRARGTRCCKATESDIIECIRNYPARKDYARPYTLFDIPGMYVCWNWAEEAISACCLTCSNKYRRFY